MSANALTRLQHNPILHREIVRTRALWRILLGFTVLFTLGASALVMVLWSGMLGQWKADLDSTGLGAAAVLLILAGISTLAGLGWFLVLAILPGVAATSIVQARGGGGWDEMRATLLTSAQIVDGFALRALVRFPLWLLLIPALPLSAASAGGNLPLFSLDPTGEWITRADEIPVVLGLLAALMFVEVVVSLLQLAACIAIGVAAGTTGQTRGSALGLTYAGLFFLQLLVPGVCGSGLWFVTLVMGGGMTDFSSFSSRAVITWAGVTLAARGLMALYQLGVFVAARAYAANRIEYSSGD